MDVIDKYINSQIKKGVLIGYTENIEGKLTLHKSKIKKVNYIQNNVILCNGHKLDINLAKLYILDITTIDDIKQFCNDQIESIKRGKNG